MTENLIAVNELIPLGRIPDGFSFFKDGISNLTAGLYVSDLQSSLTEDKEEANYSFTLVSFVRLAAEIPGTNGLALVLNPGLVASNRTEIPLHLGYSLPILKYISEFRL